MTNAVYRSFPEFVGYTNGLKQEYCDIWGIDYVFTNKNPHPNSHPQWCKLSVILDEITDCDWVVWMDCDAATVGMGFDLQGWLSTVGDRVVMQKDKLGWNSGVFAVSNRENGLAWLRYIESQSESPRYAKGWRDQQAMIDSFNGDWGGIVLEPPPEIGWNNYMRLYNRDDDPNPFRKGHWVLHLPGVGDHVRNRIFRNCEWLSL